MRLCDFNQTMAASMERNKACDKSGSTGVSGGTRLRGLGEFGVASNSESMSWCIRWEMTGILDLIMPQGVPEPTQTISLS